MTRKRFMTDGGMDASECRSLRSLFRSGGSLDRVMETTHFRRQTVTKHLTGDCSHDHSDASARPIPRSEVLDRTIVSAADCIRFRQEIKKFETILEYAEKVDHSYQVVQRHATGGCNHEIDEPPIEVEERGDNVTTEECRNLRSEYYESCEKSVDSISEESGHSPVTIKRHIKFRCSHPPAETLATEVEEVHDILTAGPYDLGIDNSEERMEQQTDLPETDGQNPSNQSERETNQKQISADQKRIIIQTEAGTDLKEKYQYRCQICGEVRQHSEEDRYAETHHLKPLEEPHNGPDEENNILVLCPNHHADIDNGQIAVHPETLILSHGFDQRQNGVELTTAPSHHPDPEYIEYHNKYLADVELPEED